MEYIPYENQKEKFDKKMMRYIAHRIFTPIDQTDACKEGIIDDIGNELLDVNDKNKWAFTPLDRFVLACKQHIGEDKLQALLNTYGWLADVDPLTIMNGGCESRSTHKEKYDALEQVISKFDGADYLPDGYQNTSNYLRDSDDNYEFPEFKDRCSWALTLASFLLYTIRQNALPTSIDFEGNIVPSTTLTFNVRPYNDYESCKEYLTTNGLITVDGITSYGIRILHSISKIVTAANLLSNAGGRIEERSNDWKKLSGLGKK